MRSEDYLFYCQNDNDGLRTVVELENHLNPYDPLDALGDLDHDGLSNLFEYLHGLNMQAADTDHDGIVDGAELSYWENRLGDIHKDWSAGQVLNMSLNYTLNPDVDRDNITDGKEIKGYEVKIITGWKSDGTPIGVMRDISPDELDPLIPYGYNSSDGFHWSDVDSDGIPDVVEAMLSNASYFLSFYNFTHKDDWMKEEREKLWDDYNWTISYYFSLKLNRSYDVILTNIKNNPDKYIPQYVRADAHNASCGENATKYLTSQFNPMIVENMPPVIVKFDVNFTYYFLTAKMQVYAVVRDAGAIKKIELIDSDFGQSHTWNLHERSAIINYTFWASPWGANLGANITLIVEDMRGNNASMSHVVYGPEGVLIKMFLDWLAPFLQVLAQVGSAVARAVNVIVEWIESIVRSGVDKLVSSIISVVNSIKDSYEALVWAIVNVTSSGAANNTDIRKVSANTGANPEPLTIALVQFFNSLLEFAEIVFTAFALLMTGMAIAKAATFGAGAVVSSVVAVFAKDVVITALGVALAGGIIEKVTSTASGAEPGESLLTKMLEIAGLGFLEVYHAIYQYFEAKLVSGVGRWLVKYIGIALALTSFLWEYVSPALRKNPTAAWISVFLSGAGLVFFLYEKFVLNGYEEKIEGHLFPIVSIIEWIIPFAGFGNAVFNLTITEGS